MNDETPANAVAEGQHRVSLAPLLSAGLPTTEQLTASEGNGAYSSDNVQIFRDAAHIRQRPGMYIGDTSTKGLHHLVYELIYNSVDEALAGYAKNIHVKIHLDGSLSVDD